MYNKVLALLQEEYPEIDFTSSDELVDEGILDSLTLTGIIAALSMEFFSYYTIALFKVQAKATDAFTSHLNLTTYQILCCRLHHLLFYHI